jgi:hypothetical protein
MILSSHGALDTGVKPTQVSRELRKSRVAAHMDSGKSQHIQRLTAAVFDIEECTGEPGFESQAHFSLSDRRRVAKGVSERPYRPPKGPFQVELAFLNFTTRLFLAAQRQNGMRQGVRSYAHSSLR